MGTELREAVNEILANQALEQKQSTSSDLSVASRVCWKETLRSMINTLVQHTWIKLDLFELLGLTHMKF
jgi:hypothetical protein